MKRTSEKILSLLLCAALLGCCVCAAFAVREPRGAQAPAPAPAPAAPAESAAALLDRTVYVFTDAGGTVEKAVASDWLRDGAGDDSFTQGAAQDAPPVQLQVSYWLDGKSVAPDALAGQSGSVRIRFDYSTSAFETVDGEDVRVPYAVLTGVVLDNDVWRHVAVTNGRLFNDGDRTIAAGLSLPGLQESLGLDADTLTLPSYFEITADVRDFSLGMTVSLATCDLFGEIDETDFDSADLTEKLGMLADGVDRLLDGSARLYDGLDELLAKSGALSDGAGQLAGGAASLKSGAGQLAAGAAQLSSGLQAVTANNDTLLGGAGQVFDALLAAANSQLGSNAQLAAAGITVPPLTAANYGDVLTGLISAIDGAAYQQALAQVTAGVEAQRGAIEQQVAQAIRPTVQAQVTAAVRQEVAGQVIAAVTAQLGTPMDAAAYEAAVAEGLVDADTQAAVSAAIEAQMNDAAVLAQIASLTDAQMASDEVTALIAQNTDVQVQQAIAELMASPDVQQQITDNEAARAVISLKSSLDSYSAFEAGLRAYTAATAQAAQGAASLQDGANRLCAGADSLSSGAQALNGSIPALLDGVTQLRDGAGALRDGIVTLDEAALEKLTQADGGARLRAVLEAARLHRQGGTEKYLFRTDEIG